MNCKKAGAKSPLRLADIIGPAEAVPLLQSAFNLSFSPSCESRALTLSFANNEFSRSL
jgi:hypothetical protein